MKTYQDLVEVGNIEDKRMDFIRVCINAHKNSNIYRVAELAKAYDKKRNPTILQYQKLLYTVNGKAIPDSYSANYKLCNGFFPRMVIQQNQYLLGNGVSWANESTKERLGANFDSQLQKLGKKALIGGVAFGFFNVDHLEIYDITEFVPLYDEETGALKAGIRFWQIAPNKPTRAVLFELDGLTEYIWNDENPNGKVYKEKQAYITVTEVTEADGAVIVDGENYPNFPVIPLFANDNKQSELVGLQEQIDCYDLIKSGFANTVDEASIIYWTLQNAGGMDDIDLAQFVQKMRTVHASAVQDDGATAESHTLEAPFQSREALLKRLENDIYKDYMALNPDNIAGGAVTATQIQASYEPMNEKADLYEFCVLDFLNNLCELLGIEDENPTFTRNAIVNRTEEIQMILQASAYLDADYVTKKILTILGDGDKADEILQAIDTSDLNRMNPNFTGEINE